MIDKLETFIATRAAKRGERGASAVEYGLLIAGIAALIVVAVFALGPVVKEAFDDTCTEITGKSTTIKDAQCADGGTTEEPPGGGG